jgi:hypothetical protein
MNNNPNQAPARVYTCRVHGCRQVFANRIEEIQHSKLHVKYPPPVDPLARKIKKQYGGRPEILMRIKLLWPFLPENEFMTDAGEFYLVFVLDF